MVSGQTQSFIYSKTNEYFRLNVEEGKKYMCYIGTFGGDPNIKFYSGPLRIVGVLQDAPSIQGERLDFVAEHSGSYYITVTSSRGSFFYLEFRELTYIGDKNYPVYVNFRKLIIILLRVGMLIPRVLLHMKILKSQETKRILITCSRCKNIVDKDSGYCEYCGNTFVEPKI